MTDFIDLGIGLDPTPFQQGARAIEQSADGLVTRITKVETSARGVGGSIRDVFKASSGTIQSLQGVDRLAESLTKGAGAASLMSAALLTLEVAKTADDYNDVAKALDTTSAVTQTVTKDIYGMTVATTASTAAAATATTVWSRLFLILKANPLISIVAGLSLISTAMSLFSGNAKEGTKDIKDQTDAIDSLLRRSKELETRQKFGGTDDRKKSSSIIDTLATLDASKKEITAPEAASLFDLSEREFRTLLGEEGLRERLKPILDISRTRPAPDNVRIRYDPNIKEYDRQTFTGQEVIYGGRQLLERAQYEERGGEAAKFRADEMEAEFKAREAEEQRRFEAQRQAIEESRQAMAELRAEGDAFGRTIGSAFLDAAEGARSVSDIVRETARALIGQAVGNAAGGLGSALFGAFAPRTPVPSTPGGD